MSDEVPGGELQTSPQPEQSTGADQSAGADMGMIAYICYAVGIIIGVTSLVGLIIAYMQRGAAAGTWRESHYTWLIRTFWIGLLYAVISGALTTILIGGLMLIAVLIWYIIRIVKGWQAYTRKEAMPNPESWLLG